MISTEIVPLSKFNKLLPYCKDYGQDNDCLKLNLFLKLFDCKETSFWPKVANSSKFDKIGILISVRCMASSKIALSIIIQC